MRHYRSILDFPLNFSTIANDGTGGILLAVALDVGRNRLRVASRQAVLERVVLVIRLSAVTPKVKQR